MAPGDVFAVEDVPDLYYVDTGMYGTPEYGAVYIVDAERPAFLDTGIGTHHEYLLDALDELGIDRADVGAIMPTHVHLDHAGGAGFLAEACPNADVYVHEIGARHLVDPSRLVAGTKAAVGEQWQYYVEPEPVPEDRVVELTDGDTVDLGDHTIDVHHAPGHAPHQVVFHDTTVNAVQVADAAGIYVPALDEVRPTTPPSNFDYEQAMADVALLRDLDPDHLLYPHFGPAPTADRLEEYESVLTDWVEAVEAAWEEHGDEDAVVAQFDTEPEILDLWDDLKATEETAMNVRGVLHYIRDKRN